MSKGMVRFWVLAIAWLSFSVLSLSACGPQGFQLTNSASSARGGFRAIDPRELSQQNTAGSRKASAQLSMGRMNLERTSSNGVTTDAQGRVVALSPEEQDDTIYGDGYESYFDIPPTLPPEPRPDLASGKDDEEEGQKQEASDKDEDAVDTATGIPLKFIASRGTLIPSIYFFPSLQSRLEGCEEEDVRTILSPQDEELGKVCRSTYNECDLQGSCLVSFDGVVRFFNIHSVKDGKSRFFEVKRSVCRFGYGVQMICLDPYYTLAADLKIYKPGDVVFVPQIEGIKLPDGSSHTGFFVIRDQGRAIKGRGRFDFFTGFSHWRDPKNPFTKLGLSDKKTRLSYLRIQGDLAEQIRNSRHYPKLPPLTRKAAVKK